MKAHGDRDLPLLTRLATVAESQADELGHRARQMFGAEATGNEHQLISFLEVAGLHVAPVYRPDGVILRHLERVTRASSKEVDRLDARAEDLGHRYQVTVFADDLHDLPADQVADRHQTVACCDERVTRHARVARVDPRGIGARVPVIDRGVELHPRVAAGPGRLGDHPQQIARPVRLERLAGRDGARLPVAVVHDRLHEVVGDAHRVVRVLEEDR